MAEPGDFTYRERWWKQIEDDPNPDITDGLLAAAYAVSTAARRDGTRALMSRRRLAQILRKSEATAKRRIQKLVDLGYLDVVERGGRRGVAVNANVYDLALSHRLTQMTQWESGNFPANDVPSGQNDVPSGQNDVPSGEGPPVYSRLDSGFPTLTVVSRLALVVSA